MTLKSRPSLKNWCNFTEQSGIWINKRESNRLLTTVDFKTNVSIKTFLFQTLLANILGLLRLKSGVGQAAHIKV